MSPYTGSTECQQVVYRVNYFSGLLNSDRVTCSNTQVSSLHMKQRENVNSQNYELSTELVACTWRVCQHEYLQEARTTI